MERFIFGMRVGFFFGVYLEGRKILGRLNFLNFFGELALWICKMKDVSLEVEVFFGVFSLFLFVEEERVRFSRFFF